MDPPIEKGAGRQHHGTAAEANADLAHHTGHAVLVDGFVWLGEGRPGLGARLYEAIGGAYPVVGVAKNPFRGAPAAAITRGGSARPLYITAVGLATSDAAARVESRHGPHRIPTLLKAVDRLCRDG